MIIGAMRAMPSTRDGLASRQGTGDAATERVADHGVRLAAEHVVEERRDAVGHVIRRRDALAAAAAVAGQVEVQAAEAGSLLQDRLGETADQAMVAHQAVQHDDREAGAVLDPVDAGGFVMRHASNLDGLNDDFVVA